MEHRTTTTRRRAPTRKNVIGAAPNGHDEIARRAYERYVDRGGEHGYDLEDWLQAEREVTARAPRRES
jgi:hypothetical protein